jgi:hypothetical protein
MKVVYATVTTVLLASLLAGPAMAQRQKGDKQGRGGAGMRGAGGVAMILSNPGAQEELKLAPDQIAKVTETIAKVRKNHEDDFAKVRELSPTEQRQKMQELGKAASEEILKDLEDTLKPEQTKRLKEIELQVRGMQALLDPDVATALTLSDAQKEKIKSIEDDLTAEMRSLRPAGGPGGGGGGGAGGNPFQKMQALRKEATKKALGVLTDAQKKTWQEMTGKPFEMRFQRPGA